jgi:hypothetical protein
MQTYFESAPAPSDGATDARHHCDEATAHVGVVFVHGVGFQEASDTFVGAIGPLIRLIREAGYPQHEPLPDPVVRGGVIPGTTLPYSEIAVPTVELGAAQHWIVTEAWWASSFRPPSVGTMLAWLGGEGGIARAARRLGWRPPASRKPRPSKVLGPTFISQSIVLGTAATLLLVIYAALRTVFSILPVQSIREMTIGKIDRFMTGWAGDMRVMTNDEAQAGIIRSRIVEAIEAVQKLGCDRVVVVAHSGGVVASYMTLTDPANTELPVKKLITFGQGLSIAWRLLDVSEATGAERARNTGGFLALPLPASIEWTDYFATDDPVPAGPIWTQYRKDQDNPPPEASRPISGQAAGWSGVRVSNRWQMPADHGEYFMNDEQFLLPLARSIFESGVQRGAATLFRATDSKRKASARREQRVRVLDMWRKLALGAGVLALFGSLAVSFFQHWQSGQPVGLYQPAQPVITAAISLWDGLGFLDDPLVLGKTPPLWQATLVGYMLWPALIGGIVWTLVPRIRDWRSAWTSDSWPTDVGVGAVTLVLLAVMGLALLIGIPGLVGVGIISSPLSKQIWFRDIFLDNGETGLFRGMAAIFGPGLASPLWGILMTVAGLALVALVAGTLYGAYRLLQSDRWLWRLGGAAVVAAAFALIVFLWAVVTDRTALGLALLAFAAVMVVLLPGVFWQAAGLAIFGSLTTLLVLGALACMVWALVGDVAFRINAVGWAVILVAATLLQRTGVWRWNAWDHQERMETRSRWRDGKRRRPLGRPFDITVLTMMATALFAGAISIALVPFDPGWLMLGLLGIALMVIAIVLGGAQDAINGRALAEPSTDPT